MSLDKEYIEIVKDIDQQYFESSSIYTIEALMRKYDFRLALLRIMYIDSKFGASRSKYYEMLHSDHDNWDETIISIEEMYNFLNKDDRIKYITKICDKFFIDPTTVFEKVAEELYGDNFTLHRWEDGDVKFQLRGYIFDIVHNDINIFDLILYTNSSHHQGRLNKVKYKVMSTTLILCTNCTNFGRHKAIKEIGFPDDLSFGALEDWYEDFMRFIIKTVVNHYKETYIF